MTKVREVISELLCGKAELFVVFYLTDDVWL